MLAIIMFPFDKRDGRPFFASFLGGFFDDFDILESLPGVDGGQNTDETLFYAYSSYTGADGYPVVEEHTNIPALADAMHSCGEGFCSPQIDSGANAGFFHDVFVEGDEVKVVLDLPGVEEKDIKINACGSIIHLSAEGIKKYCGVVKLPFPVFGCPHKSNYKNGILELVYLREKDRRLH
jgi:hypothetical protein